VHAFAGGEPVGGFDVGDLGEADVPSATPERGRNDEEWVERSFDLPARMATARTPIELRAAPEAITTFHYWCSTVDPIP
jgi:hypothetical protein